MAITGIDEKAGFEDGFGELLDKQRYALGLARI